MNQFKRIVRLHQYYSPRNKGVTVKSPSLCITLAILVSLTCSSPVLSQDAPFLVSYHGRLTDGNSQALPDSTVLEMAFAFYEVSIAGPVLYVETQSNVLVRDGRFQVLLGSGDTPPEQEGSLGTLFQHSDSLWLGLRVGEDEEMLPRMRIGYSPRSIVADNGMPQGAIILWSGMLAEIPAGWQLCDGTNGTPDLGDRFVMGAADAAAMHQTSGSHELQLTESHLPVHVHTDNGSSPDAGSHRHQTTDSWYIKNAATFWAGGVVSQQLVTSVSGGAAADVTGSAQPNHTHSGTTSLAGNGTAFDNRPLYYRLAYIMKL